jgi:hypothetical protein
MTIDQSRTQTAVSPRTGVSPRKAAESDEPQNPGPGMIVSEQYEPDARDTKPISHDQLNVLIVDDNKLSQIVAATLLDDLGCTYEFASTGVEGLQLALQKTSMLS